MHPACANSFDNLQEICQVQIKELAPEDARIALNTSGVPPKDPFHRLLLELGNEHEKQVHRFHREIQELRKVLSEQRQDFAASVEQQPRDDQTNGGASAQLAPEARLPEENRSRRNVQSVQSQLDDVSSDSSVIAAVSSEDATFHVRTIWKSHPKYCPPGTLMRLVLDESEIQTHKTVSYLNRMYSKPDAAPLLVWDVIALALLIYDILLIPLAVFDVPQNTMVKIMGWISQVFWNFDVLKSFFVGYYDEGNLIMDPKRIGAHYLKTWFVFDVVVVAADWGLFFGDLGHESTAGISRVGRSMKFFRILRVMRLLRISKMSGIMEHLQDQIYTESTNLHFRVLRLVCRIALLNHFIACAWYWIGSMDTWGSNTWLTAYDVQHKSFIYRYSTSLHWSLSQLGVGVTSIEPQNELERVYALLTLFLALVIFGSMVGTITTIMQQIQSLHQDRSRQFWLLRRFLTTQTISRELSGRIKCFLTHAIEERESSIAQDDVEVLQMLSEPLFAELQFERYHNAYYAHPFFNKVLTQHDLFDKFPITVLHKVSKEAVSSSWTAPGDVLFCTGDDATCAYFVKLGVLTYARHTQSHSIRERNWIAEAVLWTRWKHHGHLVSKIESEVLTLHSRRFSKVISRHDAYWRLAKTYAALFVAELNNLCLGDHSDVGLRLSSNAW